MCSRCPQESSSCSGRKPGVAARLRKQAKLLRDVWKDPRTPWYAKAVLATMVAYVLSPIDLIPDFIPVVGYLDDLLVIALGLWLASLLVPRQVWEEHRRELGLE